MKYIEVWDVQEWDGGDRHNHAYYINRGAASEAKLRERHPNGLFLKLDLVVFDSFDEVDENTTKKLRQSAWDKLTPMERKAIKLEKP